MSNVSRSNQSAPRHTGTSESISASVPSSAADARLDADAVRVLERAQVADHLEAGIGVDRQVVDAAEVDEHVHREARIVAEEERHLAPAGRLDHGGVVAELRVRLQDAGAELGLEQVEDLLAHARAPGFLPMVTSACSSVTGSVRGLTMPGVRSPRAILSWSSRMPSITASGRGGQPGT